VEKINKKKRGRKFSFFWFSIKEKKDNAEENSKFWKKNYVSKYGNVRNCAKTKRIIFSWGVSWGWGKLFGIPISWSSCEEISLNRFHLLCRFPATYGCAPTMWRTSWTPSSSPLPALQRGDHSEAVLSLYKSSKFTA
jgi:hypothetical protein